MWTLDMDMGRASSGFTSTMTVLAVTFLPLGAKQTDLGNDAGFYGVPVLD